VIATKGGFIRGGPDYADFGVVGNREYLRQCAYLSARRLGIERIDLYYLHNPRATDAPFENQIATLAELREQGVIRHIGLSNVNVEQFRTAREIVEIAAVTAHYNIGDRTGAGLLAAAEDAGVVFSPWHPTTVPDQSANASHFGDVLAPICEKHHATVSAAAPLAFYASDSRHVKPRASGGESCCRGGRPHGRGSECHYPTRSRRHGGPETVTTT